MNQKENLDYLTKLLGSEEKAKAALEMKTSLRQKELQEAGVESKENTPAQEPAKAESPDTQPAVNVQVNVDDIMKQIEEKLGLGELSDTITAMRKENETMRVELEKIPVLEGLVQSLSKSADDALAETLTPPASRYAWMSKNRPSQSTETEVKEEDPIRKEQPSAHWLETVATK